MPVMQVVLHDIAPEGLSLTVDDPAVWAEPVAEFGIPLQVRQPLVAEVFVLPGEEGCLMRGRIRGKVSLPCDRCAEDALVVIDHEFDDFEEYPGRADNGGAADTPGEGLPDEGVIVMENDGPVLDLGRLLWEEFSLSLPVKPLCAPACRGICPQCGKNLNEGPCGCPPPEGDPRLAALRHFKVKP